MEKKKEEQVQVKEQNITSKQISELIISTNKLVQKIDKLVSLFDEAAKHVGEVESTEARVALLSTKLEALLEQNKAIAHGLILLEKYVRGKSGLQTQTTEYQ